MRPRPAAGRLSGTAHLPPTSVRQVNNGIAAGRRATGNIVNLAGNQQTYADLLQGYRRTFVVIVVQNSCGSAGGRQGRSRPPVLAVVPGRAVCRLAGRFQPIGKEPWSVGGRRGVPSRR